MIKELRCLYFVAVSLLLFLCSTCSIGSSIAKVQDSNLDTCQLIPFVGIDNFKLGIDGPHAMKRKFGKEYTYDRKWMKAYEEIIPIGNVRRVYNYTEKGLKFISERHRRLKKFTVNSVYITSPCDYKTKMGIGIGSTLAELRLEFPSLGVYRDHGLIDGVNTTALSAFYIDTRSHGSIYFYCFSTLDTAQFKVEKIHMSYSRWQ